MDLKSCQTSEGRVEIVIPWQLCRTIGPLTFHSQEIDQLLRELWPFLWARSLPRPSNKGVCLLGGCVYYTEYGIVSSEM